MPLLDVNVCLYAWRRESPDHERYKSWLEDRIVGDEAVGIPEPVLASVIRTATNHRIYREPSTPGSTLTFCDALLEAPATIPLRAGERHWPIFTRLVTAHALRANDVPDAYLAALALENGATWVTTDRGFGRFENLRLLDPLADG